MKTISNHSGHGPYLLEYGLLNTCSNIFAFTTTRQGGCSLGNYASLNCTPYTGDVEEHVRHNQELLCNYLPIPPQELIIPYQTHTTHIRIIDTTFLQATEKERNAWLQDVDALISAEANCCLCISTADCIPVLLYDKVHQVIAAVHAGWRGTVNGIVRKTLQQMQAIYGTQGSEVYAVIGPGISLAAFEIGEEVYAAFEAASFPMERISKWNTQTQKHHIDLWEANRWQLQCMGISDAQIEVAGICTYQHVDSFFSARRMGLRSGRILSGIVRYETSV